MAKKTKIEWTDATWSPITGCSVVSAGCKHCYAMKLAGARLQHHPSRAGLTIDTKSGPVWSGQVRFNAQWLDQPLRWKRPRMVFVCAHSDLFHESVPDKWIDRVFAIMALAPRHTFQVLTKRPDRMCKYFENAKGRIISLMDQPDWIDLPGGRTFPRYPDSWPLKNVWFGVSVENQDAADERIPILLDTPAAVRWVSAEPLLGRVYLDGITSRHPGGIGVGTLNALSGAWYPAVGDAEEEHSNRIFSEKIDWVVGGGESGPDARPMHPEWIRSLRDQCKETETPFFFKQWGEWSCYDTPSAGVVHVQLDGKLLNFPTETSQAMKRVGKKLSGRELDGVIHDEYPG